MTSDEIRAAIAASQELQALAPNTQAIADALSVGRTRVGSAPRSVFAMWCGSTGLRAAIQDHANDPDSPLRAVALTILDLLQGGVSDSIDMAHPSNQAMLGSWVQAGALTQAEADELVALATVPDPVDEYSVRVAIFNDDGSIAL